MSTMSDQERFQMVEWLEQSHKEFLSCIEGLSEEQWNWKPAQERWSVGQTAEHIVLGEALLFDAVHRALAAPFNPDWEELTRGKTAFIVRVMPVRRGTAQAPEPIVPRHGSSAEQVRARFEEQRVAIRQFALECGLPLKGHTALHPMPIFGDLNAHQWLIYVPLHSMRHVKQIAELKATPGYPG